MSREPIIVSPYETFEQYNGGENPSLVCQLSGPDYFKRKIEKAYGDIAERGGQIVLEGLITLSNEPSDLRGYSYWTGPSGSKTEPSLLIIADFPNDPNQNLSTYAPTE